MFATVEVTARARRTSVAPAREGECGVQCVNEGKVARVRAAAPAPDAVQQVADLFGALADPTRVRLLDALSRAELCVCDLATVVGRSMPATSQQLKILRGLGLVRFRMDGKLAYYSLADEWVRSALADALRRAGAPRR